MVSDLECRMLYLKSSFEGVRGYSAKFAYLGKNEVSEFKAGFLADWNARIKAAGAIGEALFVPGATVIFGLKMFEVEAESHLAVS